ncbi:MAG: tRNA 2-thiouridine(34) synthase MnmA [Alphaproteobacteria bacterium]
MRSNGANRGKRIVVAMSGGVDSSVTAALLREQGFDVVGITLRLYDSGQATARAKTCCAGQDIYDAKRVASRLGIPHYVFNYENRFRENVVEKFAESYAAGETPIPCVLCNQKVKFRDLLETAKDLEATALATGHYVRRVEGKHGAELHRAKDAARDQSYFLFATTQAELDYLRFPLGDFEKDETRTLARRFGLEVAEKPDSQDICFVPDGRYGRIVERLRPEAAREGDIMDEQGRVLGRHQGILHYTIGQRRGLGLSHREPLYVLKVEPDANRIVVGPREALATTKMVLRDVNWLGGDLPAGAGVDCEVKIRSTQAPMPAHLAMETDGRAGVTLFAPEFGVSPGQACVFYDGERVLGGGWIAGAGAGARPADATAAA